MRNHQTAALILLTVLTLPMFGAVSLDSLLTPSAAVHPPQASLGTDLSSAPDPFGELLLFSVRTVAPPLYDWINEIRELLKAIEDAVDHRMDFFSNTSS